MNHTQRMALDIARRLFPTRPAIWTGDRYIVVASLTSREPIFSIQYSASDRDFITHTLTGRDLCEARAAIEGKKADL